jgi:hypothetical protein
LLTEIAKSSLSSDTFANLLKWNCWILSHMFYSTKISQSCKIKKNHIKQENQSVKYIFRIWDWFYRKLQITYILDSLSQEAVIITTSRNRTWYQNLNCSTKVSDHGNYVFRFFNEALVLQMLNHLNKTWG